MTSQGFRHYYIDGFAGVGMCLVRETHELVKGSALSALRIKPPFRYYNLIDYSDEAIGSFNAWMQQERGSVPSEVLDRVSIYCGDANQVLVNDVFPGVRYREYERALCLLDPYGLDLKWTVIQAAGDSGTIEIFLNFPTMAMNRKAQEELVADLEKLPGHLWDLTDDELEEHPEETQLLSRAHRHVETIRELDFAPVISGSNNDPPAWHAWTDKAKVNSHIARFKRPLFHEDEDKRDPLAFLIVKSMLLTGFDAPVEQVMYLDRDIRQAELLQAVARVNRTCETVRAKKSAGFVVDYYGVARNLREALSAYAEEDIEGTLQSLKDEIPKLRDRHERVLAVFKNVGIDIRTQAGQQEAVDLLEDERIRADFLVKLRLFLTTLDLVLPRPEALPYTEDAKRLGLIQLRARNHYRDDQVLIGKEVGEKVRQLIDQHVIAEGIDPAIPPISILDAEFEEHVARQANDRAKASDMEHAARYHIRKHFDEDPEHYQKLSERLESILDELEGHWDELVEALNNLSDEIRGGRTEGTYGLDPKVQAPFLGVLRQEVGGDAGMSDEDLSRLALITVELVDHIQSEIKLTDFWQSKHNQEVLHNWIVQSLDDQNILPFSRLPEVADRLVELAKKNHQKLIQ